MGISKDRLIERLSLRQGLHLMRGISVGLCKGSIGKREVWEKLLLGRSVLGQVEPLLCLLMFWTSGLCQLPRKQGGGVQPYTADCWRTIGQAAGTSCISAAYHEP